MIEIRLRAAASNPSARPWRLAVSVAVLVLATVAPVVTSRAQDASSRRGSDGVESVRALKAVTLESGRTISIDAGDSISITSGNSSITLQKDGKIIIKGTEVVIDAPQRTSTTGLGPSKTTAMPVDQKSEIF